jgi:hypothetical protein
MPLPRQRRQHLYCALEGAGQSLILLSVTLFALNRRVQPRTSGFCGVYCRWEWCLRNAASALVKATVSVS